MVEALVDLTNIPLRLARSVVAESAGVVRTYPRCMADCGQQRQQSELYGNVALTRSAEWGLFYAGPYLRKEKPHEASDGILIRANLTIFWMDFDGKLSLPALDSGCHWPPWPMARCQSWNPRRDGLVGLVVSWEVGKVRVNAFRLC
jgi:hypothetical protein